MKKSIKNQFITNTKEKTIVHFSSQKLSQEKNKDPRYESNGKDYDLGHMYGSW
jgi:hypothetical protein